MDGRTAVIAIGGNSLIKDKYHQTVRDQYVAASETCYLYRSNIRLGG
jgi:carbamate kinase